MDGDVLLVEVGSSNSGFGIVQRKSSIRPVSPCCGAWLVYTSEDRSSRCKNCEEDYASFANAQGCSLSNWLDLKPGVGSIHSIIESWLKGVLDDETTTLKVKW